MSKGRSSLIYSLFAVLLWSTVATAFKITLRYMDPVTMLFFSSSVSLVSISLIIFLRRRWKILFSLPKRWVLLSLGIGLLNPFLYYMVLFMSYDRLPAQVAQSINYSWPVVLTLMAWLFLGQRIGRRAWFGVILGFFGVVLVSTRGFSFGGASLDVLGILMAILSAVIWASFWTMNMKIEAPVDSRLFFAFLGGLVPISLLSLVKGAKLPALEGIAAASYVGLFEMGITFILWSSALSLSRNAARTSTLIYLTPFISLVLIGAVLSERILISTVIGLFLIVSGIIISRTGDAERGT